MTDTHSSPPRRARRLRALLAVALFAVIAGGAAGIDLLLRDGGEAIPATPPIPTNLAPDAVTERAFPSLTYGIHAFLWWNETMRTIDLDNIRLMKFSHVKQRFSWSSIEPVRGEWHWDKADGVVDEVNYRGL
ncbi:MAG: beta-galactosidase, partial [Chloroflexota bacterium]